MKKELEQEYSLPELSANAAMTWAGYFIFFAMFISMLLGVIIAHG
ncbi:hypothetical protein [Photobacterium jeanii]|nr:hypothetical protein [Photobacterium jeanii]